MLKKLLKNTRFLSEVRKFYNTNKEYVLDIILFGSTARGKDKPNDIDLLVLTKKKIESEKIYQLRKRIENILKIQTSIGQKTYDEIREKKFIAREGILSNGISVITKDSISENFGFSDYHAFKYDLSKLKKSQRMTFYYSLNGRGDKTGMTKHLKLKKLADNILLSPSESVEETKEYLSSHNITFLEFPLLIPKRISNIM